LLISAESNDSYGEKSMAMDRDNETFEERLPTATS